MRRQIEERPATLQRAGESHRLNRRMLYQIGPHAVAEDHVEDAGGHPGAFACALDRLSGQLRGDHMAAVRLEHDRAAGGERGGGVAARGGKRQREVAGAEDRHRAERRAVLTQIGTRQGGTLRQRAVDAHALDVAAPQQRGEQPHLAAGSGTFAAQPRLGQGRFLHGEGEENIIQRVYLLGDGVEKVSA